jgi:threonine dehydrogenase-like Zn-dependent dehydrogenase
MRPEPTVAALARRLGRAIGERGCCLLTGVCPELPHEAVLGATEVGGHVVGISPAATLQEHVETFGSPYREYEADLHGARPLGSQATLEACVKVTRPGGTMSNVGYHGNGDYLKIPRLAWGVGMSDKTIRTALCPGGAERMKRLMRLLETGRVEPMPLTTHRFPFRDIQRAFRMMETKEDGILKALITFD